MTSPHDPVLLQHDPEVFQVLLGNGAPVTVRLPHAQRRGLGLHGVPPLTVATEIVRFLLERGEVPEEGTTLGAAAGRYPEFVEELRARLG